MKRVLILVSMFALSACGLTGFGGSVVVYQPVHPPPLPGYVYMNGDGSCWADDVHYAACPWTSDRQGYSWSYQGYWYWQEHYAWRSRRHPPPRAWRHPPVIVPRHPYHGTWNVRPPRPRVFAPPVRAR